MNYVRLNTRTILAQPIQPGQGGCRPSRGRVGGRAGGPQDRRSPSLHRFHLASISLFLAICLGLWALGSCSTETTWPGPPAPSLRSQIVTSKVQVVPQEPLSVIYAPILDGFAAEHARDQEFYRQTQAETARVLNPVTVRVETGRTW